jgi:hypothetical protein
MANESKWRMKARNVILRVLRDTQGQSEANVKKAISAAYPFGERAMHPYKIWLDEVKRQTGHKPQTSLQKKQIENGAIAGSLFEEEDKNAS